MTKQEAIYWRNFIIRTIEDRLPHITVSDIDSRRISQFAASHMQTITGQQFLPQGIFREFLELFATIPEIQEDIIRAQQEIRALLNNFPVECSNKSVEQMFDGDMWEEDYMWMPSMDIDDEGYVALNIIVDDEGYAHFTDEDSVDLMPLDGEMYDGDYMHLPSYNLMDTEGYVPLDMIVDIEGYGRFLN